ncbi:hypothetical protein [Lysobacter claricitrinus]|uniref:hypothetical protein n=1 Tax=Lysobacter claricitrinus TaxID=3367728 RepID=UPI0037DAC186
MRAACALLALVAAAAFAQDADPRPAAGVDLFLSNDADNTEVTRIGVTADWAFVDAQHYRGIELERARISPLGGPAHQFDRAFLRFAGTSTTWEWSGRVGTDGDRLLGSTSFVRPGRHRSEFFVERDVLETRNGVATGQTVTFAGAAIDLPVGEGDHHQVTLLGGVQDFDDGNLRTHLRANYVQTLSERIGLSGQLRLRAFHDSSPHAGDYFAPGDYIELIPALQLRHRLSGGWVGSLVAGWGRQRQTGADWRPSRLSQATLTSPIRPGRSYLRATFSYSDTPGVAGTGYGYRQGTLQWVRPF